ncbi:multidrug ABC transporter permease/ATP-binding protein [Utexia brackfieldae]|uniref:multidrug ABC transporter permease/ATP-binding protein n=1 Tax=Utexia brackfieldae TaxID=3074108 RepID=UPI00370DA9CA
MKKFSIITILQSQSRRLIGVIILTLLSSLTGIFVMNYINVYLLVDTHELSHILAIFTGLIIFYLVVSTISQIYISSLGHHIVYEMRTDLLKQILYSDYEDIRTRDRAHIIGSLSHDIQQISFAFVRLPELLQGGLFVILICGYMAMIASNLFFVTVIWLLLTLIGGNWSVKQVYRYLDSARQARDNIHEHYEQSLDAFRELKLNHRRQDTLYHSFIQTNADYKNSVIRADSYHAFAGNFTNIMMLMGVGIIFYLSVFHHWASFQNATTIAIALLFMRTPLINAVGAFPTLIQALVSLKGINQLNLAPVEPNLAVPPFSHDWQQIQLNQVCYQYENSPFSLKPTQFTLKKGETVFVIGQNGSGKSTFSLVLSGLVAPSAGTISIDDQVITAENIHQYRQLFSAVFTDFYLFDSLIDEQGHPAAQVDIEKWLKLLELSHKVTVNEHRLASTAFSQGQRKRLGLLLSALENKQVLILDEWAADQDPYFRKIFYQSLLPILKQQGYTIIAISHDDRYFHHADRIVQLDNGYLTELPHTHGDNNA